MAKSDRAKIFASFSPLKGFEEKLLQKEKVIVEKSELSEDRIEEIEFALQRLKVGDMVTVIFYNDGDYEKVTGCVSSFEPYLKYIKVAKRRIDFADIFELKPENECFE